ncbi:WD40 repeat domain-containing serine/threonine protein kinase [Microtetraspora fusca]|uniref:WD40 repeat domain-containing serine/threonine protein kinase n=1 Tax=Microtetraspora fusca TaxID=1997 RepID=UPI000834FE04|nr:serine/threonine-protein kinase [Microtetraspora fusca]
MAASELQAGDPPRLGDYMLAGRLGAGGQGVVYEAYDAEGSRVAIKVLHAQAAVASDLRSRFGKEATAARRVASFCTARVLAVDLDAEKPYIVSEYIEGPSLRQAVAGGRRFAGDDLYRLATAVATALTAIHDAGVIHRDLKPDNVLLGPDGPRVIDFGVARTLEMSLTATGLVTGTPTYMAPEVFTGQRAGAPADVFSWGAIVVYAASGDDPFRAETLGAVMHRVLATDPDLDDLPPVLRPLVAAALSKDPLTRPTARELLLGLISGFTGTPSELLTVGSAEAGLLSATIDDPALGTLAEDAYGLLTPGERNLVPDLFLRMVGIGNAGEVVMRPLSPGELSDGRTPAEQAALDRVRKVFSYLLATRGDSILLARPALVQAWPRLRSWFTDERDGLPAHAALHAAAVHWNDHGRLPADLLQGSRLEDALRWAATGRRHLTLTKRERDFLDASNAAGRQRVRRRRVVTVALAVLLVLALLGGALAVWQTRTVTAQQETLARRLAETTAVKAAADADTMRTTDPVHAMLLSVAAWRLSPTPVTRSTLHNAWAQRERQVFVDPDSSGQTVRQITADGRRFVSVSPSGVRVYDLRTGARVGGWDGLGIGDDRFRAASLSPSGRYLAVAAGRTIRVWDTATGRPTGAVRTIRFPGLFAGMTYQTGDRYIKVDGFQGGELWDTKTGATVRVKAGFATTSVTPANDLVAGTDAEHHFALLRLPSGTPVKRRHGSSTCARNTEKVAISPDGHILACGTGSDITFMNVRTGRKLNDNAVKWGGYNRNLWFSPDGRYLVVAQDTDWKIVRVTDGDTLLIYRGTAESVGFDGATLRYLADDTVVSVDIADTLQPARLPGRPPSSAVFSPDGRFLATSQEDGHRVVLWDVAHRRPLGPSFRAPVGETGGSLLAFSQNGRLLGAIGQLGDTVAIWDTSTLARVRTARLPKGWMASSLGIDGDGTLLAVTAARGVDDFEGTGVNRVFILDVRQGRWSRTVDFPDYTEVVFQPGSRRIAPVSASANQLVDLSTGRPVGHVFGPGSLNSPVKALGFSADGATVATVDQSGRLAFWDVRTGNRHGQIFRAHGENEEAEIVFSPRGDVAASTGSSDVQLWDAGTPRKLGPRISGSADQGFLSAAFGSGGAVFHTIDEAGVLRDITVDPRRMAAEVCARMGRTLSLAEWRRYLPGVPYRDVCR